MRWLHALHTLTAAVQIALAVVLPDPASAPDPADPADPAPIPAQANWPQVFTPDGSAALVGQGQVIIEIDDAWTQQDFTSCDEQEANPSQESRP